MNRDGRREHLSKYGLEAYKVSMNAPSILQIYITEKRQKSARRVESMWLSWFPYVPVRMSGEFLTIHEGIGIHEEAVKKERGLCYLEGDWTRRA
jgi:hypothetical protein